MATRINKFRPREGWKTLFYLPLPGKIVCTDGTGVKTVKKVTSCHDDHHHLSVNGMCYHVDEYAKIAYSKGWSITPVYDNLSAAANGDVEDAINEMLKSLDFCVREARCGREDKESIDSLQQNTLSLYIQARKEGIKFEDNCLKRRFRIAFGSEMALAFSDGSYMIIQERLGEPGYDFTLYGLAYNELDGGVLDGHDNIVDAACDVIESYGKRIESMMSPEVVRSTAEYVERMTERRKA